MVGVYFFIGCSVFGLMGIAYFYYIDYVLPKKANKKLRKA